MTMWRVEFFVERKKRHFTADGAVYYRCSYDGTVSAALPDGEACPTCGRNSELHNGKELQMSLIPPPKDRKPLGYFVLVLLVLYVAVSQFMPPILLALYWAWVILGIAYLVQAKVESSLPRTFLGNLMRVIRAHAWPYYIAVR